VIAAHPVQAFLYLVGLVLLLLAGFGVNAPRAQLGWLGLACWLFAFAITPMFGG